MKKKTYTLHFLFFFLAKIHFAFAHNFLQDQAKKALESALGGKKTEFEKWDKEIKKREEAGGGGNGGGGWWRRWFGGSDGEHFWHEAQQVSLTLLALTVMVKLSFTFLPFSCHFTFALKIISSGCNMHNELFHSLSMLQLTSPLLLQLLIYVHVSFASLSTT